MDALVVSQTIFYMVSSIAILALGLLLSLAAYHLIRILKNTRDVSEDLSKTYAKAKRGVQKIISLVVDKK